MNKLKTTETVLEGQWIVTNGAVKADNTASRIDTLVKTHLRYVASRDDGWTKLYFDPDDGRYWELSYPSSGLHGGGPPRLEAIPADSIAALYIEDKQS